MVVQHTFLTAYHIFSFCVKAYFSIIYLTISPWAHTQVLWALLTVLVLLICIKSSKSVCVCVFAEVISPCHAHQFTCVFVNGCASCDLWLSQEINKDAYYLKRPRTKFWVDVFLQPTCWFTVNICSPLFNKLMVKVGENVLNVLCCKNKLKIIPCQ